MRLNEAVHRAEPFDAPAEIEWIMTPIPVLLSPLDAPIHEASHIVGTRPAGGSIRPVRLWQPIGRTDAPVAMIEMPGRRPAGPRRPGSAQK